MNFKAFAVGGAVAVAAFGATGTAFAEPAPVQKPVPANPSVPPVKPSVPPYKPPTQPPTHPPTWTPPTKPPVQPTPTPTQPGTKVIPRHGPNTGGGGSTATSPTSLLGAGGLVLIGAGLGAYALRRRKADAEL